LDGVASLWRPGARTSQLNYYGSADNISKKSPLQLFLSSYFLNVFVRNRLAV